MTNRDLYLRITELGEAHRAEGLKLKDYLSALLAGAAPHREAEGLTPEQFADLLEQGFSPRQAPADTAGTGGSPAFTEFVATLRDQITDLREMEAAGILDQPWIGFGVDAPSGRRWYNFTPSIYLECACAGTLGGWQPGDQSGRDLVPGLVTVPDGQGGYTAVPADEVERPVFPVDRLTWEQVTDFLICGQQYE